MKKILIIGYGNTIRSDDSLGPIIADRLTLKYKSSPNIQIASYLQLDIQVIEDLKEVDVAIFIDAREDNDEEIVKVTQISKEAVLHHSHTSHSISLPTLVKMTESLYNKNPFCYAVAPKGYDFEVGEILSEKAEIAATKAIDEVDKIINTYSKKE